jgi:hypothetical protein
MKDTGQNPAGVNQPETIFSRDTKHTTHYNTHGLVPNRPPTKTFI